MFGFSTTHRWAEYCDWDPEIEIGGRIVHLTVSAIEPGHEAELEAVAFEAREVSGHGLVVATVPGPGFEVRAVISTDEYGRGEVLAVTHGSAGEPIELTFEVRSAASV